MSLLCQSSSGRCDQGMGYWIITIVSGGDEQPPLISPSTSQACATVSLGRVRTVRALDSDSTSMGIIGTFTS